MRQLPLGVRLRDRASFESFHSARNLAAVETLRQVATAQRQGVFWLVGNAASGKSHLLQAVCVSAARERRAAYLPLRELYAGGPEVLAGWQDTHCVCVDDVDTVLGDLVWERSLFNLYRELEDRGASLVCAAPAAPRLLRFALPDLASRCAAALLLTLAPMDEADQRLALQRRAEMRGIELPDETANYLLRRLPRDMERLCDLLETLDVAALTEQRRLTIPFVREVLEQQLAGSIRT